MRGESSLAIAIVLLVGMAVGVLIAFMGVYVWLTVMAAKVAQ